MSSISRRAFLQRAVIAGTTIPLAASKRRMYATETAVQPAPSANAQLQIGVIGPRGRGAEDVREVAAAGGKIVAVCDIDTQRLAEAKSEYPDAKTFKDFRELLELPDLDAVIVATPDHMHAIPSVTAMRKGLHVYCEKPLAHSVHEVRVMRDTAREKKLITQMGTQIHAGSNYRRVVEIVRNGALGDIRRVHVWMGGKPVVRLPEGQSNRPTRVASAEPPANVDYDLWLGPAPYRPFHPSHFHFNWRYWWDFGGGVLADFGCHYMDLPHWALGLRAPLTVEAKGEKTHDGDNEVPDNLQVDYHYPARGALPAVHLTWYHGDWRPKGAEVYGKGSAVLFEGENGRLLADYGSHKLFSDAEPPASTKREIEPIAESVGHHREWVQAIQNGGTTTCNFDYSGALAETVLLGNVAYRCGKKLEWNDAALDAPKTPEARPFIRRKYRDGWTL